MGPPLVHLNWLAYNSSKAALNSVTLQYAKAFRGTSLRVDAVSPGHVSTDLNGNSGGNSPAEGARIVVDVATRPSDSPTGGFWGDSGQLPW
jgi:NAD(P)-dependent dehydrogenase (short-subunit alcohol dehydrogenase family)